MNFNELPDDWYPSSEPEDWYQLDLGPEVESLDKLAQQEAEYRDWCYYDWSLEVTLD